MQKITFKGSNVSRANTPKQMELWVNIILFSAPIIAAITLAFPYGDMELKVWIASLWTNSAIIAKGISKFFGVEATS